MTIHTRISFAAIATIIVWLLTGTYYLGKLSNKLDENAKDIQDVVTYGSRGTQAKLDSLQDQVKEMRAEHQSLIEMLVRIDRQTK